MVEVPEWIYKQFGGLAPLDAEKRVLSYHYPMTRPGGYHLKINFVKGPLDPIWIGREPVQFRVMQDITPIDQRRARPLELRAEIKPTVVMKIRYWEPAVMGFSCWIEDSRDVVAKISLGRWQDFRWYDWQVVE